MVTSELPRHLILSQKNLMCDKDGLETLQLKETKMLARIKASKSVCENMFKEPGFLRLGKGSPGGSTVY